MSSAKKKTETKEKTEARSINEIVDRLFEIGTTATDELAESLRRVQTDLQIDIAGIEMEIRRYGDDL